MTKVGKMKKMAGDLDAEWRAAVSELFLRLASGLYSNEEKAKIRDRLERMIRQVEGNAQAEGLLTRLKKTKGGL